MGLSPETELILKHLARPTIKFAIGVMIVEGILFAGSQQLEFSVLLALSLLPLMPLFGVVHLIFPAADPGNHPFLAFVATVVSYVLIFMVIGYFFMRAKVRARRRQ